MIFKTDSGPRYQNLWVLGLIIVLLFLQALIASW
jgi:hypothetical protein